MKTAALFPHDLTARGVRTALNQISAAKEPLPTIDFEHENLAPQEGRAFPARTGEIFDLLVAELFTKYLRGGGTDKPEGAIGPTQALAENLLEASLL